jgi:hypothetical protein
MKNKGARPVEIQPYRGQPFRVDANYYALHGIREVVSATVIDMMRNGEVVPQPISSKHYSGKFIVRVPPEVHRRLSLEAAESGVSLNRLASAKLSR